MFVRNSLTKYLPTLPLAILGLAITAMTSGCCSHGGCGLASGGFTAPAAQQVHAPVQASSSSCGCGGSAGVTSDYSSYGSPVSGGVVSSGGYDGGYIEQGGQSFAAPQVGGSGARVENFVPSGIPQAIGGGGSSLRN